MQLPAKNDWSRLPKTALGALALLGGVMLVSGAALAQSRATLERLTIADVAEPTTLDPTVSRTFNNRHNYDHLFEPLIHRLPSGELVGRVAESWEYSSDTKVRFKIRKGLKFHNGEPVDAHAVKYSLDRYRNPDVSEAAGRLATVSSVDIVDDYTVDVTTAEPDPLLLGNLADGLFPVPPKAHKDMGDEAFARQPVGNGPWKFERWDAGERIVASRYEDFHRGPAHAKELVLRFIKDDSARVAALLAGDVDVIRGIPAADVDRVNESDGAKVVSVPATRATYMSFNYPAHETVADRRVRQALNYAIDMDALINVVLRGYGNAASQQCYKGCLGYNADVTPYPYDLEKAKSLLTAAGYGSGQLEITLDYPIGQIPNGDDIAQAVAAMWQVAGVNVTLNPQEWGGYWSRLNTKPENMGDVFMMYSNAPGADASEVMQPYFPAGARWNWTGYKDAEVESLILQAGTMVDEGKRRPIYEKLAKRLHDDAVWVYLTQWVNLYGVRKGLDLVPRPDSQIMAYDYVSVAE